MEPERYIYINSERTVMIELWVDPLMIIPADATIATRPTTAHVWSPPLELFLEKG